MGDLPRLLDDLLRRARASGARTRAGGRASVASMRSTSGTPKASVLPEPVGDLASTSRPGEDVGDDERLDRERRGDAARGEGVSATTLDTPRSAKDCCDIGAAPSARPCAATMGSGDSTDPNRCGAHSETRTSTDDGAVRSLTVAAGLGFAAWRSSKPSLSAASSSEALPGAPVPRAPSGTGPSCRPATATAARRSAPARPPPIGARPARPRPARPRPRLRDGRAGRRRPRRRARAARRLDAAADRARRQAAPGAVGGAGRRPQRPPAPPVAELRPRGRRHSKERDARSVRHHYDVSNEFFALFLDASMTYSCAVFRPAARSRSRRRRTPSSRWSARSSALRARRARARRRLRLGQLRRPRRAPSTACTSPGITLSEPQAALARGSAAEEAGVGRPRRHPRHGLPRPARRALRRDREHRHGRARRRRADRRVRARARAARCGPAGACSTTGSRGCATASPRRARSPSATSSPTPRRCTCRRVQLALERAGFETEHVEGLRERLRRDAAPLGAAPGRQPRRGAAARRATSACASGGSTCAPRATASRPASRRSIRCAAGGRSVVAVPGVLVGVARAHARGDRRGDHDEEDRQAEDQQR